MSGHNVMFEDGCVNYEKLAKVAEFKNATTASACFNTVKRKIISACKSIEPSTPTKSGGKKAAKDQMTPKSGKKRKIPTKSPRKGHPKTEEDGDDDEKVFKKKKNQLKAEDVDDEDAQLMSGLLGFDVKKKLQEREKRTKREDDKNEAC
ncbi:hypothetical protein F5Y02DRAFT_421377 [Annulohypoxylon stygium]|nr:hypothetical protein F5Y02DRAFT_421377 [Annulohypoxylon stygium]